MIGKIDFTGIENKSDFSNNDISLRAGLSMSDNVLHNINRHFRTSGEHGNIKSVDDAYIDLHAKFDENYMISEPTVSLVANYRDKNDDLKTSSFSLSDDDDESVLRQLNDYARETGVDLFNRIGDLAVDASMESSANVPVPDYEKNIEDDDFEDVIESEKSEKSVNSIKDMEFNNKESDIGNDFEF